jgi:hypothetical protein
MTKNRKSIWYASSPKRETMRRQKLRLGTMPTAQLNIDCKVKHRLRLGTMPTAQLECEGAEVNLFSLVCIVPEAGDDGKTKIVERL